MAAEAVTGSRLLFDTAEPAPDGWSESLGAAATHVLAPILAPESLLVAAVWVVGAVVLGVLIRGRIVALELLGVLVWAAGLVALHGALAPGVPEPAAGPLAAALIAVAAAALWARTTRSPRGHPISAVAPHFRRIVRQRGQPLRDGAARVPLPGV